jgi:hypothetical protein
MSLNLYGSEYLSAREAAALFSYSPDYISRLCRNGQVRSQRVGKSWFVERESLKAFALKSELEAEERKSELRAERINEIKDSITIQAATSSGSSSLMQYGLQAARVAAFVLGVSAFIFFTATPGALGRLQNNFAELIAVNTDLVFESNLAAVGVTENSLSAPQRNTTENFSAAQTDSTYTSGRLGISARYYYSISGYHIYLKTWAGGNLSTTYTQNVSGAISSAGALKRTATKALAGAVTSAGALAKGIQYSLSLIGGMNPSGALTTLKAFGRVFAGTVTSSGAVTRSTTKGLGGAVSSAGALKRTATKTLVGAATSSGAAALTTTKALAGAVTSAGALTLGRLYARAFSGAISSAGALASVRQVYAGIPPATRTAVVAAVGRIALVAAGVRTWVVERGERTDKVEQ